MLRRYFNISALEAEHGMPAWERDLCLRGFARETGLALEGSANRQVADPFSRVPEELMRLGEG